MKETQMTRAAELIDEAVRRRDDPRGLDGVREGVLALTGDFPIYQGL
jgi:glycine/serine hydroxymethyltransferase